MLLVAGWSIREVGVVGVACGGSLVLIGKVEILDGSASVGSRARAGVDPRYQAFEDSDHASS